MTKQIILINGLGNRSLWYRLTALLWRVWGLKVHFFRFDWEDMTESYEEKMQKLLQLCHSFPSVSIIGVSAGGTAAVNLLAETKNIYKVVTVASPYYLTGPVKSRLLQTSSDYLHDNLLTYTATVKHRILSIHGRTDTTVSPRQSAVDGIAHHELKTDGHFMTIVWALTIHSASLRQFLNS
jgi:hypothetical protein